MEVLPRLYLLKAYSIICQVYLVTNCSFPNTLKCKGLHPPWILDVKGMHLDFNFISNKVDVYKMNSGYIL